MLTFRSKLIAVFLSKLSIRNLDTVKLGRLPFTRENGKFGMDYQMVRALSFGGIESFIKYGLSGGSVAASG